VKDILETNSKFEGAGSLELMELDLNSLDSVRKFAKAYLDKHDKLNVLINNAGAPAFPTPLENVLLNMSSEES
jgi:NAD(P)-dependent dehydrogenase (short-subunit alcohol dehydrogenase family)